MRAHQPSARRNKDADTPSDSNFVCRAATAYYWHLLYRVRSTMCLLNMAHDGISYFRCPTHLAPWDAALTLPCPAVAFRSSTPMPLFVDGRIGSYLCQIAGVVNAPRALVGCSIVLLIAVHGCLFGRPTMQVSGSLGLYARLCCFAPLGPAIPATSLPKIHFLSASSLVSRHAMSSSDCLALDIPPPPDHMDSRLQLAS